MTYRLLLFVLLALVGCDSQTSLFDDAVIYIDGKRVAASASISTKQLNATAYQVVSLEMTDGSRIEILARAFEEGRYVKQQEGNTSFPFAFIYVERGERPRIYMAVSGSLEIGVARSAEVEGTFAFATYNGLSSCIGCASAQGPQVKGRFKAVRRVR